MDHNKKVWQRLKRIKAKKDFSLDIIPPIPPLTEFEFFEGKKLSEDQLLAVKTIIENRGPFFIFGSAGTGKSLIIRLLKAKIPGCTVCAMTAIAAQLINGKTAHSVLGVKPTLDGQGQLFESRSARFIKKIKLLVIDEISMANTNFLARVAERFKKTFGADRTNWPKLVVVGDLLQLPPADGKSAYRAFGKSGQPGAFTVLKLTNQHRQDPNTPFLQVLNEIRLGQIGPEARALLQTRVVEELPTNCVHLHSKNALVDQTNVSRLNELPGEPRKFEWDISLTSQTHHLLNEQRGHSKVKEKDLVDGLVGMCAKNSRLQPEITLKPNARIVMLTNQKDGDWVNGSTGRVSSIGVNELIVELDSGRTVYVSRAEEELVLDEQVVGTLQQFPVRLAWALTIHRAQGQTLDRVGIDMNDHFERGMTYTALSRCKSLEGLYLKGNIPSTIPVDSNAIAYLASL